MPVVIGISNINSVSSSSVVQYGDAVQLSPSSTSKSYAGSGAFLTGCVAISNNALSATNTNDPDVIDNSQSEIASGVN
ncbi:spore germination protein [Paenibacillus sepulcri]|uniref:Spore germination protein n=1 Tax=Paenibacillus sepulcri TaxID=359917 RepID=A0ABS7BXW6_9BACL|nr:spore germination protein [Paenibacillus sepulcri]